jgi:hypothetical protein
LDSENPPLADELSARASAPVNIFISYRRDDAAGQAISLRTELSQRFGPGHVFMDVADLRPGENFVKVIQDHVARCDVLIALIGGRWASIMDDRTKRSLLESTVDYVRVELETALQRDSRVRVLPVLLDNTQMPGSNSLPRPLRRLSELAAAELRHTRWADDVARLVERIDEMCHEARQVPEVVVPSVPTPAPMPSRPQTINPLAPPPDATHYSDVARLVAGDNAVIPFLGSVLSDSESSSNTNELAATLARQFNYPAESVDLAEISQYVLLTMGKVDLYKELRRILTANCSPGAVHRFLASLPATLERLGHSHRYQLIVTTNYDDALEQACDEAQEPYDLAVYMAHGDQKGKFLHVPFDGEPKLITVPNTYLDFPIDEDGDLERTIILKIHGAVDNVRRANPWRENYVITENDYIDYLSRGQIESLVPLQLLNKMRESHCLFLGYRVRDWNLRVFLHRVWGEQRIGASSWAIGERVEVVEKRFWNEFGVDLFDIALPTYLDELRAHLTTREPTGAQP